MSQFVSPWVLVPWLEMPPATTESPGTCRALRDTSARQMDCHHPNLFGVSSS